MQNSETLNIKTRQFRTHHGVPIRPKKAESVVTNQSMALSHQFTVWRHCYITMFSVHLTDWF